ncbi:hypothetical protein CROQUDRAFT_658853 [Cronartium quercuum f. sp. fusiforme G11]|uniref:Coenzyme Q-binding protein COQ10 START domain-containing protein n=1 Tax=Cronartium quercuum f. sp. fusiforme G11 TaxID=708437 RepID=A0A9P6TB40_9BASI|nr:hypothetical protein CROQUDRAFT_658853 [Cronartium quercuum f. sp. fusiforme G11]
MSFISFNLTLKTSSLLRPHQHFFLSLNPSTRSLFGWPSSSSSSLSGGISNINNLKDGHSKRSDLLIYKETKPLNNKKSWIQDKNLGESYMLESELVIGSKTFEERYTSHASASHSVLFKCLNSTWTFHSINELSSNAPNTPLTEVSLHLAFAFTSPLHAAIGELFWKKVSERMVLAFEGRLMEVYSKKPSPPSPRS